MLIASKHDYITTIAVWIGILQFPAYGGFLILTENRLRFYKTLLILLVFHFLSFLMAIQYVEGFG